jgi:hypothetical protein
MKTRTESEPRAYRAACASLIACGLLTGCAVTPKVVRDLPELPAELAQELAVARTAPVLMTKPAVAAIPLAPRPASAPLVPSKACTSIHEGYVTFPITVCHPPNKLYQTLDLSAREALAATRSTTVPATRYFKLTSHPEVRLGSAWFCSVRGGPWYARVEGAQICNANPNVRLFTAKSWGPRSRWSWCGAGHWTTCRHRSTWWRSRRRVKPASAARARCARTDAACPTRSSAA